MTNPALVCHQCGRPVSEHDRHVRFRLPDPVLATVDQERAEGTWMSHETVEQSTLLQVPNVGPFVRSLLPVALTGGYSVTFGVWIAVHADDLQRAFRVWWEPGYAQLALDGWLANRLPTWDCLGAPVHATVRDPEHTPYITSSDNDSLSQVLKHEWAHELVLSSLPT